MFKPAAGSARMRAPSEKFAVALVRLVSGLRYAGVLDGVFQKFIGSRRFRAGRSGGGLPVGSRRFHGHEIHGGEKMRREVADDLALVAFDVAMPGAGPVRRPDRPVADYLAAFIAALGIQLALDFDPPADAGWRPFDGLPHQGPGRLRLVGGYMPCGPVAGRAS